MAYSYNITPQNQIDAAKRRITGNGAVYETALSSYLAMASQAEQNNHTQQDETASAPQSTEKVGFSRRALETSLDWWKSVTLGLGKALEGVVDFGASISGVVAGWAGDDDAKEAISDWVATDFVGKWMGELEESAEFLKFSNSYINDMSERGQRIVRGVGEGVGQMLPLILLTAATGGAATAAKGAALTAGKGAAAAAKTAATIQKAGQVANLALLGMSAAGTGTEQALNYEIDNGDGTTSRPSLDKAFLYGLASGAVEVATETLVGGPYEKVFGSGVADKMINKLAKSTAFEKAVRFAIGAVGEGVEEVVSEAVSNTLQTIYNSDHPHLESPDVQAMFEAGVIGAITSAVMSGGNVAVRKASNTMSVQDHVTDARNIERKLENLSAAESLDESTADRLQAEYERNMQGIVKRYNAASEKARARMWKSTPGIAQYINEDGTRRMVALDEGAQAITSVQAQSPAMSQALFARANEVANDLYEHGTTIADNMSEKEIANTRKLRTALKKAGVKTGATLKVVVAEHLAGSNAFIKDDVMYISRDRVGSVADMSFDFAHETSHFAEGTKEYGKLVEFLQNAGVVIEGKPTSVWMLAIAEVRKNSTAAGREDGYRISGEVIEAFIKGDKSGLTTQQMKEWDLMMFEVVAKADEIVLSGKVDGKYYAEHIIDDLVEQDRSLVKAWLKKFKRNIDIVKSVFKGDTDTAATLKWLQKVEHTFENALAASGEKYLRGKTGATDKDENAEQESKRAYDYSKSFAEQIDDYKKGIFPQRDTFIVGGTPKVYQKIGFNALPMTINRTHVDYALNGTKNEAHNIGESLLKQLPTALEHPVAVIASKTANATSVVVLLEMVHNGETVIAPVYLDGVGRQNGISIDSNAITSVHGRSNAINGLLNNALQGEANGNISVFYWDKKKTASLMTTAGVAMPQGLSLGDGPIHNIRENGSPVKPKLHNATESQQFKRWFGKSKVVNADGTPKVLYHQTGADFTIFSTENPVAGESDSETPNGIFLKENDHDIGIGGDKQMALYARIENPLHFADRKEALSWYKKHVPNYAEVQAELERQAAVFEEEADRLEQQWFDASKRGDDAAIEKIEAQEDELVKNFEPIETKYRQKLRSLLDDYFLHGESQYDGIILDYDGHRWVDGKREDVHTYIVFDNTQVKSATDNIGTFDRANPDIRYSLRSSLAAETQYTREEIDALLAEVLSGESDVFKGFSIKNDEGVRRNHSQAERNRAASAIAKALSVDGGRITGKLSKSALATVQKLVADYWQDPTSNGNAEETAWAVADKIIELATGEDNEATVDADAGGGEYYRQKAIHDAGRKLKNSLRFDDFITGELRHAFDESGLKGLRLQWGAPKGDGMGYDQFAQAIVEENGIEAYAEYAANEDAYKPEDVIIDFFKKYKAASEYLAGYDKTIPLTELLDESGIEELRGKIGRVLLYTHLGFDVTDNGFTLRMDGMKGAIGEYAWQKLQRLDGDHRAKAIDQVADYIMQSVMLQDSNVATDAAYGKAVLDALKPYLRKVDLSTVKRALASDEKGYKSITSRWAGKGGMSVNEFLQKVKEAGIRLRATGTAEQMLELDSIYDEARAAVDGAKRTAAKSVSDLFNATERAAIKQDLVTRIEAALKGKGEATKLAELVQHYEETIKEQRRLLKEGKAYNKEVNRVLDLVEKLKPNGKKHYKSGTYLEDPMFTDVCKLLGKIKYRSDIRKSGTRGLIAALGKWYNKANPLLNGGLDATAVDNALKQEHTCGYLNSDMLEVIDYFAAHVTDKGALTLDEMTAVRKLLQHIDKLVRDYDVVEIDGKRLRLSEEATKSITSAEKYVGLAKHSWVCELLRRFGYSIIEPYAVLEDLCSYEDNALLRAYEGILAGETKAGAIRFEMIAPIEDFLKEHKKYKARLVKDKITVAGHEVPVGVGLSLYMVAKQADAHDGLTQNGWGYYDKLNNWVDCGTLTDADIAAIEGELSQADKDYLKAVRKMLDIGGKYMSETQLAMFGWTDIVVEGSDYFPIKRNAGDFARSAEQSMYDYFKENIAASPSAAKARVHNAHRIMALPITDVLEMHARQVGNYAGLAMPIKEFTRLYNANVGERGKAPVSLRNTLNEKIWNGTNNYIMTLLADIQGMNGRKTGADKIFDWMRGSYAKFQLGANIKVIFSQMASYPTAFAYLSTESMTKAFTKKLDGKDMDKYCAWARVRNHDHSVVLAESVTDKIGAIGDALTKPIQWTDRATIAMLWNACQFEVERRHKGDSSYKVGSEQNKREAGKLLEQVGRRTQPNYTASERSALQRSNSQVAKVFSMFSSVPLKQLSRLVEAVGRERAIRYKKNVLHENVSAAELKAAHTYTAKAITAVTVANLLYVAMGQLVKHILAKDRKDKEGNEIDVGIDFLKDFASTTVGMLPIVKEVYNAVINGYTNEDFVSSGLNSFITSTKDVVGIIDKLAKGEVIEDKDIAVPLRSFSYALGQITGIPTRNAYNLVFGLIKRFDPAKAYEINSIFTSSATYSRDLKDAVEKGDENKAATILGLMLKDDGMTSTTPKVNEKLRSLYEAGYTVLPRTVKDTITYDGETIELSRRSQNAFKSIYGKANEEVEALINAKAFEGLDAEVQAKAIKWIYDLYYEKAVTETVGAEANSKRQLFAETMAPSKFAMAFAACSAAEGKVDRKGNTIAGSKRVAVVRLLNSLSLTRAEKALILAYLGYSVSDYAGLIKRYIAQIGLSKEQQKAFLGYINI